MTHKAITRLGVLSFLLLWAGGSLPAKTPATRKIRLNEGWEFVRTDLGSVWEAVRPFKHGNPEEYPFWTEVTLPHCFNAEDGVDPDVNYYEGPGWYRASIPIDNPYAGGRTLLEFEGAGQETEVYVYTSKVASHVGGYDSWNVDITDAVRSFLDGPDANRFGGKVPLVIRCDNSRDAERIPSDLADFNLYGGIYRYLDLVYLPAVSPAEIRITPALDQGRKKGIVTVECPLYRPDPAKTADLTFTFKDAAGKTIRQIRRSATEQTDTIRMVFTLNRPHLWDVDDPYLYTCEVTAEGEGPSFLARENFGFRQFEFADHGPFYLNGRRLLLRGTHRHEDHAGVAAAMTEEQMVREMELMKSMGVNFIRLGHYQQSEIILDLCDRLGILVWEEIPWCRGGLGGERYQEQARRMLKAMITQHFNHPAVIIWGLGNENDWPNDFPVFDEGKIRAFMQQLHALSHSLDPDRKTAIRRCAFCSDIVDVYSPSIWAGWYRGQYTDYRDETLKEMKKVRHFLHVEWGGDSHAGRHSEDIFNNIRDVATGNGADERAGDASLYGGQKRVSRDGDWSESYIVRLIDWHLKEQETMPFLTGTAYWPFKDFSTPVRPDNPVPYVNQKGVVERDLTPKEAFYVFQSYWTDSPMIHIYGHSWPIRWGEPGERKEVLVYSNCPEAELILNGVSQGTKRRDSQDFPAAGLRWTLPLQEGENHILVRGFPAQGQAVTDEIRFRYTTERWGKDAALRVSQKKQDPDTVQVEVEVVDENGRRCLDSKRFIRFELAGDGSLIKNLGTASGSSKVQARNGYASICAKTEGGHSVISVRSEGLETQFITIKP